MMDLNKMAQSALEDKKKGSDLKNLTKKQKEKRKNFIEVSELQIDDVYRTLIRKQTPEEREQLRASILDEGIRDALVVYTRGNDLVVVDGHHRLNMAKELDIKTVPIQEMAFANQDEARIWMLRNQLGRRNLGDAERIEIALKLTSFLEKIGLENKKRGKDLSANLHKGEKVQKIDRLKEASDIAKVSRRNVAKYKKIHDSGNQDLLQEVVEGKKSIHRAHSELMKKPSAKQPKKKTSKARDYQLETEELFAKMEEWKIGKLRDGEIKQVIMEYLKK